MLDWTRNALHDLMTAIWEGRTESSAVTNGPASSKEIMQVPSPKYSPHFRAAIRLARTTIIRVIVQRSQQAVRQTRFANKGQDHSATRADRADCHWVCGDDYYITLINPMSIVTVCRLFSDRAADDGSARFLATQYPISKRLSLHVKSNDCHRPTQQLWA